jgi:hypothetical protein
VIESLTKALTFTLASCKMGFPLSGIVHSFFTHSKEIHSNVY